MRLLYNPLQDQLAIGEIIYSLYWNLDYGDYEILFSSATPFTFDWIDIGEF